MKKTAAIVLITLLAIACSTSADDVNVFVLEGVISQSYESPDSSTWLLTINGFPGPTVNAITRVSCPYQPGSPVLSDTYEICKEASGYVAIKGVLVGVEGDFTRAYVTDLCQGAGCVFKEKRRDRVRPRR